MNKIKSFLGLLLLLTVNSAIAQNPTLSRIAAAPETDETELFIQQFHQVLNWVANDYPNDFKNIITEPYKDESSNFGVSAALPEAEEVYVSKQLDMDFNIKYVYVATFFEGDEDTAGVYFENLEWLITNCPFACCTIGYDNIDGGLGMEEKSTIWMSVDEDKPQFEDMLVQLRIYKSIDFTEDLDVVYPWTVVLNIKRL